MAARNSAKTDSNGSGSAAAAETPAVELTTTVVVQWPQASVLVDGDAETVVIPNTRREAGVSGGWVTVYRGEVLPVEARPDQQALLLEIGAAAGVAFAQPVAAAASEGGSQEPVID